MRWSSYQAGVVAHFAVQKRLAVEATVDVRTLRSVAHSCASINGVCAQQTQPLSQSRELQKAHSPVRISEPPLALMDAFAAETRWAAARGACAASGARRRRDRTRAKRRRAAHMRPGAACCAHACATHPSSCGLLIVKRCRLSHGCGRAVQAARAPRRACRLLTGEPAVKHAPAQHRMSNSSTTQGSGARRSVASEAGPSIASSARW